MTFVPSIEGYKVSPYGNPNRFSQRKDWYKRKFERTGGSLHVAEFPSAFPGPAGGLKSIIRNTPQGVGLLRQVINLITRNNGEAKRVFTNYVDSYMEAHPKIGTTVRTVKKGNKKVDDLLDSGLEKAFPDYKTLPRPVKVAIRGSAKGTIITTLTNPFLNAFGLEWGSPAPFGPNWPQSMSYGRWWDRRKKYKKYKRRRRY